MVGNVILFDVGGPIDLEFAWEMAMDSAIAAACGLEGIRVDEGMIEAASARAVASFASDAYADIIETLCGGDPATIARVRRRVDGITANLDVFQLRPEIDGLLRRLSERGLKLGIVANRPDAVARQLGRAGIAPFFDYAGALEMAAQVLGMAPADCIVVGDRIDKDIAPARALGMATILFRSGRYRRQQPRTPAEAPDAIVTDVPELEAAIVSLLGRQAMR